MLYLTAVIGGLIVGSFINAWVYRMEKGESVVWGRSKCPHCGRILGALELVPIISYLALRGRCRGCGKGISWHYPVIEAALAAIFFILAWKHAHGVLADVCVQTLSSVGPERMLRDYVFILFLATLFIFDLKHKLVPDAVVLPAALVALVWNIILGTSVLNLLLAGAIGAGFFFLQYLVSGGRWIGEGDIRIGAMMGVMLGWPNIIPAIFISYLLGAGVSILLLGAKKASMKTAVPFGTFLAIGTFITLFWGNEILIWYFNLSGIARC